MSTLYPIALAALEDLFDDISASSDRAIFANRPATAVHLGQQAAMVKAALLILRSSAPAIPPAARTNSASLAS